MPRSGIDMVTTAPVTVDLANGTAIRAAFTRGEKVYELSNHLGNVLVTLADRKTAVDANSDGSIDSYTADVVTAQDYYPFGAPMPGRQYNAPNSASYRYGFNGKENDNDIETGAEDYGMRIYDARIGRFLSVDPLTSQYPELTPYQFASSNPIAGIDKDGGEFEYFSLKQVRENGKTVLKVDKHIGTVDHKLSYELSGDIRLKVYGVTVPFLKEHFTVPFSLNYSDLGIKRNLVSVDGKTWLVLPTYFDINDLPSLDDDVWNSLVTSEDYMDGIDDVSEGIVDKINFVIDHWEDFKEIFDFVKGRLKKEVDEKVNITQPNNTKGWKVGDPLNNLTKSGKVPKWSTIRQRYWKNRANSAKGGEFDDDNLDRMKRGLAPRRFNE